MITRPLELSSRLRPEPGNLDWLFFVNAGLLALFFALFGSRFVLTPGLTLATVAGANANAKAPTHVISVVDATQVFTSDGLRKLSDLKGWLAQQARATKTTPLLLVRSSADAPLAVLAEISSAANATGFEVLLAASEPAKTGEGGR